MPGKTLKSILIMTFLLILNGKNVFPNEISFRFWDISEKAEERIEYINIKIPVTEFYPNKILKRIFSGNNYHPEILIVKNETAYVNIARNSEIITNRSGSTGALYFQAKVVFNLTEFDHIKNVYFVDEGEHFVPGKYERINYWYLISPEMKREYKGEIEKRLNPKSNKTGYYVYILSEIGDAKSIEALEKLKRNYKRLGFSCISIDIDSAIKTIRKRLN